MGNMEMHDLLKLGISIRKTIQQHIGIPVCVGIAPTKTLAKMANRYAKKKWREVGVFYAANELLIDEMLHYTEVADIWGIGRQYALFLNKHGFKTAYDVKHAPDEWIRKNMTVQGQRLLNELRSIPSKEWEFVPKRKKNICTSRSFGKLLTDKNTIQEAVSNHTAACALKLRNEKSCAKSVLVFIQTNPHKTTEKQYTECLKERKAGVTIQSFFWLAKLHSIDIKIEDFPTPDNATKKSNAFSYKNSYGDEITDRERIENSITEIFEIRRICHTGEQPSLAYSPVTSAINCRVVIPPALWLPSRTLLTSARFDACSARIRSSTVPCATSR